MTVFVQISEVIHRFLDVEDLVVLVLENLREVFEESVVKAISSGSWGKLLSVTCSAYGALTYSSRLNCGKDACFFVKFSCVMDWSFLWVVSVVKRPRRWRESNMSLSISLIASMRVFGPIFIRFSGCSWFGESRKNCFCEHIR